VLASFAADELVLLLIHSGLVKKDIVPAFAREYLAGLVEQLAHLWILGAGTLLMILGLIDDRRGLDWRLRLLVQFSVAVACVASQGCRLMAFINVPLLTGLISAVWIVGLINSFNMLDNMDGLAGGVAAIAAAMLAAMFLLAPDPAANRLQVFVTGLLLVVVGALIGFLLHNRPPARIFMGDAGSYFIGFLIAVSTLLATYASYQTNSRHTILAPVLVMAVPLYDMLTVIWIRLREGRSPFQADKNHFSHRLVGLGLSKPQAVLTIYLTTATCSLGALLLHRVDAKGAGIIVLLVLCILALITILETTARRQLKK
jgi:UDP-GlcNAc:undecaprenyl-phosphate/decaprenyl-phosphate GlcNAc-1-phosphate transferase